MFSLWYAFTLNQVKEKGQAKYGNGEKRKHCGFIFCSWGEGSEIWCMGFIGGCPHYEAVFFFLRIISNCKILYRHANRHDIKYTLHLFKLIVLRNPGLHFLKSLWLKKKKRFTFSSKQRLHIVKITVVKLVWNGRA